MCCVCIDRRSHYVRLAIFGPYTRKRLHGHCCSYKHGPISPTQSTGGHHHAAREHDRDTLQVLHQHDQVHHAPRGVHQVPQAVAHVPQQAAEPVHAVHEVARQGVGAREGHGAAVVRGGRAGGRPSAPQGLRQEGQRRGRAGGRRGERLCPHACAAPGHLAHARVPPGRAGQPPAQEEPRAEEVQLCVLRPRGRGVRAARHPQPQARRPTHAVRAPVGAGAGP